MSPRALAVVSLLSAWGLAGCADSPTPADGGAPDLQPAGCVGEMPDGGVCVTAVSGALVDEAGAPVNDLLVTVCGDGCFYGHSGPDGRFTTEVKQSILVEGYAVLIHGRPGRINYYAKLPPLVDGKIEFPKPFVVPSLPAGGPDIARDNSAQVLTSGDVTLTLAAGTEVDLDVEDVVDLPVGGQLRALRLANPSSWPFVDAANLPDVLYAISPFECLFTAKAQLGFANVAGLPAGAAVDVLSQRGLIAEAPPAGALVKVASAHVSGDGQRIEMDPGEGITKLSVIALKRK